MALVNQAPPKIPVVELRASLLSFMKSIFEGFQGFPDSSVGEEYACSAGDPIRFLSQEDLLEKG